MSEDKRADGKRKVYSLSKQSRCYGCDRKLLPGDIAKMQEGKDEREVLCRKCAKLDGLEILLSGNAKITRLVKKYSADQYVIVKWSEIWKTYERVGLLVEPQAIDQAERECGIK